MKLNIVEESKKISFLTLFGSQLGQAKSISEDIILPTASNYGLTTLVLSLNEVSEVTDLANLECPLVIVTSTTGEGEPPENADKFWRKIRRKVLKPGVLSKLSFTLLGLGDTNFNSFCNCGKEINKRLLSLGATHFYPPNWADDATGQEEVIESWLEDLWTSLEKVCTVKASEVVSNNTNTATVLISGKRFLTSTTSNQDQEIIESTMEKKEITLTLPSLAPSCLNIIYDEPSLQNPTQYDLLKPPVEYPLIGSDLKVVHITDARILTKPNSLKTTIELTLNFEGGNGDSAGLEFDFEPGDAIGIVCKNSSTEVESLLDRLGFKESSDLKFEIQVKEGSKGKMPNHIPVRTSLKDCLTYFCDIRQAPKKSFLRLLAESCSDEDDKNHLLELCSRQGANLYNERFRDSNHSLLDILLEYPSCSPKPQYLLEHLPRLLPRAYSICSSPLSSKSSFKIAYNIIEFPSTSESEDNKSGRKYTRYGVCTGYLTNLSKEMFKGFEFDFESAFKGLSLDQGKERESIIVYKRKNHFFRLPSSLNKPVIMVGPGTGIAPFIGFIEHRLHMLKNEVENGKLELYFGCRNKELDYLYENELNTFLDKKVLTNLYTTFSRDLDNNGIKYVQDQIDKNQENVVQTLLDQDGYLYVCGSGIMAKNVRDRLTGCIQRVKEITAEEAKKKIDTLILEKRYVQDVWI